MLEKQKVPFYELMSKFKIGKWNIRVWTRLGNLPLHEEFRDEVAYAALQILKKDFMKTKTLLTSKHIIETLQKIPDIAACEIIDYEGNGIVAYFEW